MSKSTEYQIIARKFRPQTFRDVVAQEAVVKTLKNAIHHGRLAQAYLFCGSRGTGKTTLARLFAKALNCLSLNSEGEPCNECTSCREITAGVSLDVLEIDGASHRGIDDIRQINENVGYAAAAGGYKVYLIDEVHMLTKEAFNALLKTLEEPPPRVKFFFATTEPHKVPATILSRCQRFNLGRIPLQKIVEKLKIITAQLGAQVDEEALLLVAQRAEGGLRDAESLLDQILAFQEGAVDVSTVRSILGLMPREVYFALDQAGKKGEFAKAFELAHQVFSEGKDLIYFVEELTEHIRTLLLIKCADPKNILAKFSESDRLLYQASAALYTEEQCLHLLDYLIDSQQSIRFAPSGRFALEAILLHVMRSHFRLPIEVLVQRLAELEKAVQNHSGNAKVEKKEEKKLEVKEELKQERKVDNQPPVNKTKELSSISEDPTPSAADLGIRTKTPPKATAAVASKKPGHYDTLLQFAAIELDGRLQKK